MYGIYREVDVVHKTRRERLDGPHLVFNIQIFYIQ